LFPLSHFAGLLGVFGSILGGTVQEEIETQKEVNEKMTSVLEQTLLKNVSLEVCLIDQFVFDSIILIS
jgi:hypothetical protein